MIWHLIGFFGMACVCSAYFLAVNNVAGWGSKEPKALWLNLCGAIALLISLCVHFNLGSFIIELFWIAIAVKGLIAADAFNFGNIKAWITKGK